VSDGRSTPPPTDAALVAAVAGGSEDALAELYDRHAPAIHAATLRMTGDRQVAEEIVQEVFLTLWNRAERFDPAAGSLAAWLGTIARNRAVDRLRAAGRRPRLVALGTTADGEPAAEALDRAAARLDVPGFDEGDPVAVHEAAEARTAINRALAAMPEAEREVILLAYRDELSQSEIAARLEWPLGTVKTRTRRALGRLRAALADTYGPSLAPLPPAADVAAAPTPLREREP
jgi:RNA polymerase sigma-70 factor (ECF subfamily)